MAEDIEVAIVGAGQAGLALSYELSQAGVEHVLLERGKVAQAWRRRWDSFSLVLPNWTLKLPGGHYDGDDPDGFMSRDELVAYLQAWSDGFEAPVREEVEVRSLRQRDGDGFLLDTSSGDLRARHVVAATGGYQKPFRPRPAADLPEGITAIDADDYSNPDQLAPGGVLVVGSGQTGCQLAEEIHESGRRVVLACGKAPWAPRRIGGRDILTWLVDTPFMEATLAEMPSPAARLAGNAQISGKQGGRDLNYRTLQSQGVELAGHLQGFDDQRAHFADDVAESVAFGDARYDDLCQLLNKMCAARDMEPPPLPAPPPFACDPPGSVELSELDTVIFATGYRPDYQSWMDLGDAFDDMGFPVQHDGSSTVVPGLHFMGVHFQRKRKSATFLGVGEDAAVLAEAITARRG